MPLYTHGPCVLVFAPDTYVLLPDHYIMLLHFGNSCIHSAKYEILIYVPIPTLLMLHQISGRDQTCPGRDVRGRVLKPMYIHTIPEVPGRPVL